MFISRIECLYDALGNKKRQITYSFDGRNTNMKTTDFIGNFVYVDGIPAWNNFDEGRVVYPPAGAYFYENYIKDHLGSVRVTYSKSGTTTNVRDVFSYYPFGMTINSLTATSVTARETRNEYLYNGKMFQDELGLNWLDYGARFYDPIVGRWWSVDPLVEQSRRWSPYNYCVDNPIRFIDPDGRMAVASDWIPDEKGNLIAEQGDNAQTLSTFLGTSQANAQQMINSQNLATETNNGSVSVKAGETLTLDNVFTRSINNSTSDLTIDVAIAGTSQTGATPEDYYNCWGSAISGSQGQEIQVGVGIPAPNTFDAKLASDYTPTTEANAQFGKTVLRFADAGNNTQHGAVFYGKSQNGTTYVYTKNGWYLKPQVMKLSDLQIKIPSYGTVQGTNPANSGYYQPKNP